MNMHKNARLTPLGRERVVRQVESGRRRRPSAKPQASARGRFVSGLGVIVAKDWQGLQDRSSRPHRLRRPTPQTVIEEIERLRRQRWTGKQIAAQVGVSPATVSRVLRRLGLNKLRCLGPAEPVRRYERENPGELIHIDIKKLGRIGSVGIASPADKPAWSIATSASVGSTSMSALTMLRGLLSCRSWPISAKRAPSHSSRPPLPTTRNLNLRIERVMTDNGSCYRSKTFRAACNASAFVRSSPGHTLRRPTES